MSTWRFNTRPGLLLVAALAVLGSAAQTADAKSTRRAKRTRCDGFADGKLSGNSLLVLLNKRPGNQLNRHWAPGDLVWLPSKIMIPHRSGRLRRDAARSLRELVRAARAQKLNLRVRSAYRSYKTQCAIYVRNTRNRGSAHTRRFSALPGRSQHQLGTSVDFTSARMKWNLTQRFAATPEGRWLANNAARFGFVLSYPKGAQKVTGYAYEPWHYRYIGRQAAQEMKRRGLLLERYLSRCAKRDRRLSCPRPPTPHKKKPKRRIRARRKATRRPRIKRRRI